MRERPILFSALMARAIPAGTNPWVWASEFQKVLP